MSPLFVLDCGARRGSVARMPQRLAGLLLPAFTPCREGDLGIGDTRSMRRWIDHCATYGIGFLQLLPINETGADFSPYNAISSVALEPLYLTCEPDEIPGLTVEDVEEARRSIAPASAEERVNYPAVRQTKRVLLEKAWARFRTGPGEVAFYRFRREEAVWLEDYCMYRWLMDEAGGSEVWDSWPEEWQTVEGAGLHLAAARAVNPSRVDERLEFHAWVQWLCFRQWRRVRQHADDRGVKLMGDIPIGVSRYSSDVFFNRADFDLDRCGGAPPETMFKHDPFIRKWGQNWGIPLFRWNRMTVAGFPWWRRRVSKLTEVFHIFRIDHILGFYRIYSFPWQPRRNAEFLNLSEKQASKITGGSLPCWSPRPDDTPAHRALNRDEGDLRLRMVKSAAGEAEVVGEDLGCVPDYVRPHLASLDIAGFRIPHWDFDEKGNVVPPEELPECSFVTYATHDHESLPAMWTELRRVAGDSGEEPDEREKAADSLRLLADFAGIDPDQPYGPMVKAALFDSLIGSRSRYAAVMITDLCDLTDRINSPGTVGPHNWSFRLGPDLEVLALEELEKFKPAIMRTGRG